MRALALVLLAACARVEPPSPPPALSLDWSRGPANDGAPVLVLLHGLGDSPDGILGLVDALSVPVEAVAPRAPDPWNRGYSWFTPGAAKADPDTFCAETRAAASRVAADLEVLDLDEGGTRPVVLTGFSQGGILSFQLAFSHPSLFDAVAPLAGYVPGPCLPAGAPLAQAPPLTAFHGDADPLLPVDNVREAVSTLEAAGWRAELRTYPGLEHRLSPALVADLSDVISKAKSGQ